MVRVRIARIRGGYHQSRASRCDCLVQSFGHRPVELVLAGLQLAIGQPELTVLGGPQHRDRRPPLGEPSLRQAGGTRAYVVDARLAAGGQQDRARA